MIDMIVTDKNEKISYVYLNNNKIRGYSFIENKISNINKEYIESIFNSIRLNSNCKYMTKYDEYDFYYDEESGLKHFIKDGKENIDLFIKYNTTDGLLYFAYKGLHSANNDKKPLKMNLKEKTIILSKSLLVSIFITGTLFGFTYENEIRPNYNYLEDVSYIELLETMTTTPSVDDTLSLILNSNKLSESQKQFLANKNLLDDVIPYYNNTSMELVIKQRLQDLSIIYIDEETFESYDENGNLIKHTYGGYYNGLESIIAINNNYIYESPVLSHEFIHLLQEPTPKFSCIIEPSASIISSEYFGVEVNNNAQDVKSLKLLMDVVGSKVLWEYNFKSNDSLLEIFKENLSEEEYQELTSLLSIYTGALSDDGWDKVNSMYYKIAKKTMSEEEYNEFVSMHSDEIAKITNDEEEKQQYYFNERKMSDTETFVYKPCYHCEYLILKDEYDKLKSEGKDVEIRLVCSDDGEIKENKVIAYRDTGNIEMSIEEGIRVGIVQEFYFFNTEITAKEYNDLSEKEKACLRIKEDEEEKRTKESFKNDSRYQINKELVIDYNKNV